MTIMRMKRRAITASALVVIQTAALNQLRLLTKEPEKRRTSPFYDPLAIALAYEAGEAELRLRSGKTQEGDIALLDRVPKGARIYPPHPEDKGRDDALRAPQISRAQTIEVVTDMARLAAKIDARRKQGHLLSDEERKILDEVPLAIRLWAARQQTNVGS